VRIRASDTSDALGVQGSTSQGITLLAPSERAGTGESLPVEAPVGGEWTEVEVSPVETSRLLRSTVIVGVGWTFKGRCIRPTSGRDGRSQGNEGGKCGLHGWIDHGSERI
jgi:hypothetical protein